VSGQRVAASEPAATFGTGVWSFTSVEFRVAFQIMQTAEACLARRTLVRLFLTVGQEVAFKIVVSSKVRGAIWAFVALRIGRLGAVLVPGQAHLALRRSRVMLRERSWKCECAIARVIARVGRDRLVVMLRRGRTFLVLYGPSGRFNRRRRGSRGEVVGPKTRQAHRARLHVVARDPSGLGDDDGFCSLLDRSAHLCRLGDSIFGSAVHGGLAAEEILDDGHGWVGARLP
jgi:hypothetical protein